THNQSVDSELIERTLCRRTAHRILRAKFILAGKFRSFGKFPRADLTLEVALDAPKQFVHRLTVHLQTCHSNLPVKLQPNRPMRWRHLSHTEEHPSPRYRERFSRIIGAVRVWQSRIRTPARWAVIRQTPPTAPTPMTILAY